VFIFLSGLTHLRKRTHGILKKLYSGGFFKETEWPAQLIIGRSLEPTFRAALQCGFTNKRFIHKPRQKLGVWIPDSGGRSPKINPSKEGLFLFRMFFIFSLNLAAYFEIWF
jgi:hypothetical protein